jgi:enoyl-CoA hydratase/carnithine racemase
MNFDEIYNRFATVDASRDDDGVLTITLHAENHGPLHWNSQVHAELPELFAAIAADRDNRVVILTGTGDAFIAEIPSGPGASLARGGYPIDRWDALVFEGQRMLDQLLSIPVPMIAAVNGRAVVHSELAVLCDIVLARTDAYFQDTAHVIQGVVPGDGMHVIWPMLLGPNRGRYFLLTGEKISALEAQRLGVVGEVLEADALLPRAQHLAHNLARRNPIFLRNTRQVLTRQLRRALGDDLSAGLVLEAFAAVSGASCAGPGDE